MSAATLRQKVGEPLFPDLLWARPENKQQAGKVLVIGGNSYSLSDPAMAYNHVEKAGVGAIRVLLPDKAGKLLPKSVLPVDLSPTNVSGSFALKSLDSWLEHTAWADAVLLAGDFGRNSETAILVEKYLTKTTVPLIFTNDALHYLEIPVLASATTHVFAVGGLGQLQRILTALGASVSPSLKDPLQLFCEKWEMLSRQHPRITWVSSFHSLRVVATNGAVCVCEQKPNATTTKPDEEPEHWRLPLASVLSVYAAQHLGDPFKLAVSACA
jgi:hypothetical protein